MASWRPGSAARREKHPDVGIWFSRHDGQSGRRRSKSPTACRTRRRGIRAGIRCCFKCPSGPLLLFYKVGPSPSTWWGMLIRSDDGGQNAGRSRKSCPTTSPGRSRTSRCCWPTAGCFAAARPKITAGASTWNGRAMRAKRGSGPASLCDGVSQGAIQPTILRHGDKLQILCRNRMPGPLWQSWSDDGGRTWSKLELTDLPHPGSGIDGVTLADGRQCSSTTTPSAAARR